MTDLKEFANKLVSLSVKEVSELADILKNEHGIEPAVAAAVSVESASEDAGQPAEKSNFDVILKSSGSAKLAVIKLVKELSGLGLKEAKALVDGAPKPVKENLPKSEAESIKGKLEEAGAEVELK